MTNTLGIMLEILNNYPSTRLSVRIIGVIKRQFFLMVTHVFDNSDLSKEIFAVQLQSTPGELLYALWDMVASTCLRSFRLYGDQAEVSTQFKHVLQNLIEVFHR